jgi:hypothetical protein
MTDVRELGFCGVDCSACPNHLSGKCPDCRHSRWPEGDPCPPVACCGERQIDCCGRCADFPCAMIMMIGWCNAGKRCTAQLCVSNLIPPCFFRNQESIKSYKK